MKVVGVPSGSEVSSLFSEVVVATGVKLPTVTQIKSATWWVSRCGALPLSEPGVKTLQLILLIVGQ